MEIIQQPDQMIHIIPLTCHQMPTAHIQPLDLRQESAETLLHHGQGLLQVVRGGFAKCMKVQSIYAFRQFIAQQVSHHPHTGTGRTGVVQISLHIGILRVNA